MNWPEVIYKVIILGMIAYVALVVFHSFRYKSPELKELKEMNDRLDKSLKTISEEKAIAMVARIAAKALHDHHRETFYVELEKICVVHRYKGVDLHSIFYPPDSDVA